MTNPTRIEIGDRVRLAKVHHSHSAFVKARKGQWGDIIDTGVGAGFRRCLVCFDGDSLTGVHGTFWIGERYLERMDPR
jgi:hypothetical protein